MATEFYHAKLLVCTYFYASASNVWGSEKIISSRYWVPNKKISSSQQTTGETQRKIHNNTRLRKQNIHQVKIKPLAKHTLYQKHASQLKWKQGKTSI